jgi:hypothetical protein
LSDICYICGELSWYAAQYETERFHDNRSGQADPATVEIRLSADNHQAYGGDIDQTKHDLVGQVHATFLHISGQKAIMVA